MKILGILEFNTDLNNIIIIEGKKINFKNYLISNIVKKISIELNLEAIFIDEKILSSYKKHLRKNFLNSFDKFIIWSIKTDFLMDFYIQNSEKFIFVEQPIYKRDIFKDARDQKFFRIMSNTHLGNNFISRYNSNEIREGFDFETTIQKGRSHILIINQMINDSAIRPLNPYSWMEKVILKLSKISSKKILIREHPLQIDKGYNFLNNLKKYNINNIEISKNKMINDDLKNASCSIMISSGSAIDSLLMGVPVVVTDIRSHVYEIVKNDINEIKDFDNVYFPKLDKLFSAISNTHFSLSEIISGYFWRFLKNYL